MDRHSTDDLGTRIKKILVGRAADSLQLFLNPIPVPDENRVSSQLKGRFDQKNPSFDVSAQYVVEKLSNVPETVEEGGKLFKIRGVIGLSADLLTRRNSVNHFIACCKPENYDYFEAFDDFQNDVKKCKKSQEVRIEYILYTVSIINVNNVSILNLREGQAYICIQNYI